MLYPPTNSPILIFSTFDTPPPTFVAFSPCCLTFTLLLQYAMLILQSIPHSKKRTPFAFQNESFYPPKRILLQRKRTPFRERKESFWNYALLQGYNISIASAPLHASCRHHEGGVEQSARCQSCQRIHHVVSLDVHRRHAQQHVEGQQTVHQTALTRMACQQHAHR